MNTKKTLVKPYTIRTAAEILQWHPKLSCKRDRAYVNWETLELVLITDEWGNEYAIDLERCNDSAQMLDYIFQIADKPWASGELLKDFFAVLGEACYKRFKDTEQGVFCPCGHDKEVNWITGTTKRKETTEK